MITYQMPKIDFQLARLIPKPIPTVRPISGLRKVRKRSALEKTPIMIPLPTCSFFFEGGLGLTDVAVGVQLGRM